MIAFVFDPEFGTPFNADRSTGDNERRIAVISCVWFCKPILQLFHKIQSIKPESNTSRDVSPTEAGKKCHLVSVFVQ